MASWDTKACKKCRRVCCLNCAHYCGAIEYIPTVIVNIKCKAGGTPTKKMHIGHAPPEEWTCSLHKHMDKRIKKTIGYRTAIPHGRDER